MENQLQSNLTNSVSPLTKNNLLQMANWGRILAIIGFVSAVFNILKIFKSPSGSLILGTLIMVAISVTINYVLFQASTNLKRGVEATEQGAFNEGLINLKKYFKIYAVLLIVGIVFCVLAFLLAIAAGSVTAN
jgi:ABC-type Fe3+ transport system permease subunit